MNKKLIEYIGEMDQVNYANVQDFFKELQNNPPEIQVNHLANVLLYIEQQEMLQNNKEDVHADNKTEEWNKLYEGDELIINSLNGENQRAYIQLAKDTKGYK